MADPQPQTLPALKALQALPTLGQDDLNIVKSVDNGKLVDARINGGLALGPNDRQFDASADQDAVGRGAMAIRVYGTPDGDHTTSMVVPAPEENKPTQVLEITATVKDGQLSTEGAMQDRPNQYISGDVWKPYSVEPKQITPVKVPDDVGKKVAELGNKALIKSRIAPSPR